MGFESDSPYLFAMRRSCSQTWYVRLCGLSSHFVIWWYITEEMKLQISTGGVPVTVLISRRSAVLIDGMSGSRCLGYVDAILAVRHIER